MKPEGVLSPLRRSDLRIGIDRIRDDGVLRALMLRYGAVAIGVGAAPDSSTSAGSSPSGR